MGNTIKIDRNPSEDIYCNQCRGECWNAKDNAATQTAALKKFGIIPNKCVNSCNGKTHCSYA